MAQTAAIKGNIRKNIQNHMDIIERALTSNPDLIVFPELSITGYEPGLAKALATDVENGIFDPFQDMADKNALTIAIGMPINGSNGIHIGMPIFQPNKKRRGYAKQMLHSDELPFFVPGNTQTYLYLNGKKIAVGICYETLQRQHFMNAAQDGADIYIASVAKSKSGIVNAYAHFPHIASEFNIPVLMANCIGFCDNFMSVGQSAVWDKNGKLLGRLENENQGILVYDTDLGTVQTNNITGVGT
ncbi:carbon-nitrogen hydrolase family protein [Maribacter polysaccharolyticus]|uniref:carbon-nitrogen hydrolase family protein n=1 Tax=Maribacter polysaccharolyticus TaxID=3020831 RepID=UPI00237F8FF9|nr:carbon-nitrogen hydrolase family protein [Maribacter polysaccharolyticus]MDE3743866.1 carbon-nitrogen hydrolase family protein [Maribacter polysaccharolyticus]